VKKDIQGKIPERRKKVKFPIAILKAMVKTRAIASTSKRGFTIANQIPKTDPAYFDFSCLPASSHRIWRYEYIFFILFLSIRKNKFCRSLAL
jgi:hypothetical protein